MKRYETMSKEKIIEYFNDLMCCDSCPLVENCNSRVSCITGMTNWLEEEVKMVPRFNKIHNVKELEQEADYYKAVTPCYTITGFIDYMKEEIPE